MMKKPIAAAREQKAALFNIFLTAILIALSVNLLTAYLSTTFNANPNILLYSSIVALLIAALLIKKLLAPQSSIVIRLRGAFAYKKSDDDIKKIKIIGYRFNDDFCQYLRSFLRENKAYGKIFFETENNEVYRNNKFDPDNLTYHSIINSVLEFTILRKLHLHLNTYFVENEIDNTKITTITRDQLEPAVLKNRVLDLITKDMRERETFMRDSEGSSKGIVCMATGKDGAIYERLSIELPPKSKIHRNTTGHLVVSNQIFDITIWPMYEGCATVLPHELMPSISKQSSTDYFTPNLITLKLCIQMKRFALVSQETMEMYEWLDSFIEELTEYISTDHLEQRLDVDMIELIKSQQ
jgi:hypothetical protein